ncbi:hypothetical protein ACLKA7_011691 [Drosophila subpalustris]
MAGPQVQHTQRPNSAYYTGLNGSGGSSGAAGGGSGGGVGMAGSASHTGLGLHALRQASNETELIYRGSHSNGTVNEPHGHGVGASQGRHQTPMPATSSNRIIQQQPAHSSRDNVVSSIAGTESCATDTLIGTIATSAGAGGGNSSSALAVLSSSGGLKKSNTQRSIEIIVDASQCGKEVVDVDDVEQGEGGGQESSSSIRKSSRHRHRPLHRRLISYLRSLFQGSAAQNAYAAILLAWGCISKRKRSSPFSSPLLTATLRPLLRWFTNNNITYVMITFLLTYIYFDFLLS